MVLEVVQRDVPGRYLLRLGMGEQELGRGKGGGGKGRRSLLQPAGARERNAGKAPGAACGGGASGPRV